MKLLIIAGGKGTRLGLEDIPKPMVLLNGKPILEHQVLLAKRYNIKDIFILSGFASEVIVNYFESGQKWGVNITHITEDESLGTSGAVKQLEGQLDDRFMVFYGDTAMDIDLSSFVKFDAAQGDSMGSVMVHPNDHPHDSDLVEVDKNNRVIGFHSKPHKEAVYHSNLVNAALYILSPKILQYIKPGESSDFGKDVFPDVVRDSGDLFAYKTTEYIKDMGTPERLEKVSLDMFSGKIGRLNRSFKQKAIFLDRDGVINREVGNLSDIEQFELLPRVPGALALINKSNFVCIVVTNQPGIAKGFFVESELKQIHKKMDTLLGRSGAYYDDLYYCPHHSERGFEGEVAELKIECECRKPKSGMFRQASKDYNINLADSWIIGDRYADIMAGKNVGCRSILLKTGHAGNDHDKFPGLNACHIKDDLQSAVEFILRDDLKGSGSPDREEAL